MLVCFLPVLLSLQHSVLESNDQLECSSGIVTLGFRKHVWMCLLKKFFIWICHQISIYINKPRIGSCFTTTSDLALEGAYGAVCVQLYQKYAVISDKLSIINSTFSNRKTQSCIISMGLERIAFPFAQKFTNMYLLLWMTLKFFDVDIGI